MSDNPILDPFTSWPNSSKCAVMLTFDFDAESMWFSEDENAKRKPSLISHGGYGPRRGIGKLLEMFKDMEVPASFYVPGWTVENHTKSIEAIIEHGHEVGHHGYEHKYIDPDDPSAEVEEMDRGLEALQKCLGVVPTGYRSPAATSSDKTLQLVKDRGFLYDSSFLDDVYPYRHMMPDGSQGPIELPFHWNLDDSAISLFVMEQQSAIFPNSHIFEVWKDEFDALYEWGGLVNMTLHPQIVGRPSRMALLRRFIEYMREKSDVWFATGTQVAQAFEREETRLHVA